MIYSINIVRPSSSIEQFRNCRKIYVAILIIANCLLLIDPASAQKVETFIEMAKKNNNGLKSLRLNYSAALAMADQVHDYPDPKINLGIGVLPVETRLGAQRFKIGISQALPWKGLLDARKEVVMSRAESMSHMNEVKEIDIEYEIRKSYSSLIYLNDRKSIVQNKLEILDVLEELAKSSLRSGKGKLSSVLLIQRAREAIISDLSLIDKQKEPPTIMINRWAGRSLDDPIEIENLGEAPLEVDSYLSFAEKDHPSLTILESQIKASEKAIQLTKYESKPKIGVGLDYALIDGRNDVDIAGNGRDVLMPMGSISIPLHTGRFEAKRQEEKLKQEAIHAAVSDLKEMYKAEIVKAKSEMEYAEMQKQKILNLMDITEETLKLMRIEYASEETRFEELLRLEMELIDYQLITAQANYSSLLAQATLKKYE